MLTRKYGPLPGWGWGIVAIAAVVLLLRHRAGKAAAGVAVGPGTISTAPMGATGTGTDLGAMFQQQQAVTQGPPGQPGGFDPGSEAGQLIAAYEQYLGTTPDAGTLNWRIGLANAGTTSVAQQVQDIATSPGAASYQLQKSYPYYGQLPLAAGGGVLSGGSPAS